MVGLGIAAPAPGGTKSEVADAAAVDDMTAVPLGGRAVARSLGPTPGPDAFAVKVRPIGRRDDRVRWSCCGGDGWKSENQQSGSTNGNDTPPLGKGNQRRGAGEPPLAPFEQPESRSRSSAAAVSSRYLGHVASQSAPHGRACQHFFWVGAGEDEPSAGARGIGWRSEWGFARPPVTWWGSTTGAALGVGDGPPDPHAALCLGLKGGQHDFKGRAGLAPSGRRLTAVAD